MKSYKTALREFSTQMEKQAPSLDDLFETTILSVLAKSISNNMREDDLASFLEASESMRDGHPEITHSVIMQLISIIESAMLRENGEAKLADIIEKMVDSP
jgi:hypothetical protein